MRLAEIKGGYDAAFSLGAYCLASTQMYNHSLRPYSGVLDWMYSERLSDVNRLLENHFAGFMQLDHLVYERIDDMGRHLVVNDTLYNVLSVHDFSIEANTPGQLVTYNEVKEKYDRRIKRFFEKTAAAEKVLFVRINGTYEEAARLERILSSIVKRDFRVLLVNHNAYDELIENDWPLEKTCAVQIPLGASNDAYWSRLFHHLFVHPC